MTAGQIQTDLSLLSGLLKRKFKGYIINEGILSNLTIAKKKKEWSYSFGRAENKDSEGDCLVFVNIPPSRNPLPPGVNNIIVKLGVSVDYINDVLAPINITIDISGNYTPPEQEEPCKTICSWHLDGILEKHNCSSSYFTHPKYHMNFGGDGMKDSKYLIEKGNFGQTLLLTTPRLVHHPMDAVLAIDFVLRNFYTQKIHEKITDDHEYTTLLQKASNRFLRPYYLALANPWLAPNCKESTSLDSSDLNPSTNY